MMFDDNGAMRVERNEHSRIKSANGSTVSFSWLYASVVRSGTISWKVMAGCEYSFPSSMYIGRSSSPQGNQTSISAEYVKAEVSAQMADKEKQWGCFPDVWVFLLFQFVVEIIFKQQGQFFARQL